MTVGGGNGGSGDGGRRPARRLAPPFPRRRPVVPAAAGIREFSPGGIFLRGGFVLSFAPPNCHSRGLPGYDRYRVAQAVRHYPAAGRGGRPGAGAAARGLAPPGAPPVAAQTTTDYDADDGLIDINNLDQLNAIRWDLDGNGIPAAANTGTYLTAFPNRDTAADSLMGCPAGQCRGYELMADLTFSASTSDPHTPFAPIGNNSARYSTAFEGNGRWAGRPLDSRFRGNDGRG